MKVILGAFVVFGFSMLSVKAIAAGWQCESWDTRGVYALNPPANIEFSNWVPIPIFDRIVTESGEGNHVG
jgi:hypothetical protein